MAGCPGTVYWNARDSLCAPTCRSCTAQEWVAMHGTTAPAYHYWTSDDLGWSAEFQRRDVCYASSLDAGPDAEGPDYCFSDLIIIDGGFDGSDTFDGGLVDSGELPCAFARPRLPAIHSPILSSTHSETNATGFVAHTAPPKRSRLQAPTLIPMQRRSCRSTIWAVARTTTRPERCCCP